MKAKITDKYSDRVKFVTDDGDTVFEVSVNEDGKSINVRGVEVCMFEGEVHVEALIVEPVVSNSLNIRTKKHKPESA